ncbi:ribonuclease P protein component [Nitrospirillum viridazoti]|uniref:Ribonuclease P protein component n=1 Tax=Nitrospirillum viridazoti CBAmc TaxID=1441467 RepID=A0A248JNS6_9PROT|nr:ribonuclease P protein component [Nitrospirillum amazonense]ASG19718.1 ribonuclease P protein component [Nitrospirillum amazonense CBAmc]TWB27255.1 ribonuclease P protein component [Nitrospirillum amazonense]
MAPRRIAVVGRLLKRSEFLAVAGARRKWATPGLILQARAHDDRQRPAAGDVLVRVGFTASKKVGNAVKRNRARRRLRAAVRAVLALHGKPNTDFVVIARSETVTRRYADLLADLTLALKKLGAWTEGARAFAIPAPQPAGPDAGPNSPAAS